MEIINLNQGGNALVEKVRVCRTFYERFQGWRGVAQPQAGQGIYLTPCRMIHTWGMKFSIDAVYINAAGKIVKILTLPPGKFGPLVINAQGVLELPAGTCYAKACQEGDYLRSNQRKGW